MSTETLNANLDTIWFCPRCYKVNNTIETDNYCFYGCGYMQDDYPSRNFGWKCPKCSDRNISRLFTNNYRCHSCHYKLLLDDFNNIKIE